jgi:hypothetical protein
VAQAFRLCGLSAGAEFPLAQGGLKVCRDRTWTYLALRSRSFFSILALNSADLPRGMLSVCHLAPAWHRDRVSAARRRI